ncbi:hypothetical protein ACWCOW_33635 [Streptomyces sp. NPDC001939]
MRFPLPPLRKQWGFGAIASAVPSTSSKFQQKFNPTFSPALTAHVPCVPLLRPPTVLFHRPRRQGHTGFNEAPVVALANHCQDGSVKEQAADIAEGLPALVPQTVACFAHDAGFLIEGESAYLPSGLLDGSWSEELTI